MIRLKNYTFRIETNKNKYMKKVILIFMLLASVMVGVSSCGNSDGGAEESHDHSEDSTHHEGDGHSH